jgi:hypothetical protein
MRSVADFTTRVRASIPRDIREELVQLAVRDTLNEFMRQSRIVKDEFFTPIPKCADPLEFIVELPDCRELVEMTELWLSPDGCTTGRRDASWQRVAKASSEFAMGWWVHIYGPANIALRVNDWQGRSSMAAVCYSYTISRDGCDVPEILYQEWYDAIRAGARARVFDDTESGVFNPRLAENERIRFEQMIAAARLRDRLNYGGGYEIDMSTVYGGALGG